MTALTTAALLAIDAMPEPKLADQIRKDLGQESPDGLDFCHKHLHRTNGSPPAGTRALGQSSACGRRECQRAAYMDAVRQFTAFCAQHDSIRRSSASYLAWLRCWRLFPQMDRFQQSLSIGQIDVIWQLST
jgi:hypothetical protein